jgi:hypothetical protein
LLREKWGQGDSQQRRCGDQPGKGAHSRSVARRC